MPLECLGCWFFFCAMWAVIQQKCPWLWKYVENVLWASCSFFFSVNYCDPTAKHYSVMDPLKLARGLPGKFNVFLWCLHGTSAEHEWEILQHKRLQLLQRWEFRKKKRKSSTPVCLPFSFGAGLLMREHLEALFDLLSQELGGWSGKFPPNPCGLSLSWLLEPEPGASAALGEIYDSLKAANFAPCCNWRIWKGFWGFGASTEAVDEFSCLAEFDAPHTGERSSTCWVFWFGSLLFIPFSFFHVDKAVFNVLYFSGTSWYL